MVKHVHFNIQKPKPLKEEVLHPHEITIPITIAPSIYPPDIHHPAPSHGHEEGFSKGYSQGYSQASLGSVLFGSSGQTDPGIHYDGLQYADIHQAYPQQQLDYGNNYALPNVQYADEIPYDMQTQYGDEVLYNPSGPTGRDIGGGGKFMQVSDVLYSPSGPTGQDLGGGGKFMLASDMLYDPNAPPGRDMGGQYPQLPQQFMRSSNEALNNPSATRKDTPGKYPQYPQPPQQFMQATLAGREHKSLQHSQTEKHPQPIAYREIKYPW